MTPAAKQAHVCNMMLNNAHEAFILQEIDDDHAEFNRSVRTDGSTLLHIAVKQGQPNIAKRLMQTCQLKDQQDEQGNTALHYAYKFGNRECIAILIEFDCEENIENIEGKIPAEY